MRGITHLLFGLILSWLILRYDSIDQPLLLIFVVLIASLLPDIDEHRSILGRKVKIIGWLFRHRGVFHSILMGVVFVIALNYFLDEIYVLSFGVAFLLHLFLDALTPAGVRPFWPSNLRVRGFIRTGGFIEKIIFVTALALFIWLLLH